MAIPELLGSVTSSQLWSFGALFLVLSFIVDFASHPQYPRQIPVMGKGHGVLNAFLDSFRYITSYVSWLRDGYAKFGKKGMAFIVRAPLSRPSEVVIPRDQLAWLFNLPDEILSTYDAHNAILYSQYNFLGRRLAYDPFPNRVMHKYLARHLSTVIPNVDDEIQHAVDTALGKDTDNWKSIKLWNLWLDIVPHVTNRLLIGPEVCRNKQFLHGMINFTNDVVRNGLLLSLLPKVLHPIFGRLFSISNYIHWRSSNTQAQPVIQRRLSAMMKKAAGDEEYKDYTPPEDFITWLIRQALLDQKTFELDPIVISRRLLPIEFAAIHTTVLTGQLWMQDLLTSDPETGILDILRAEITANKPSSGPWTKAAISKLVRLDSSIRESQRVSNFAATLIERTVVAQDGLHNPDLGWTLPKGSFVTVNLEGTHHDPDLYADPHSYDPLRYSRLREAWDAKSDEEKKRDAEEGAKIRGLGMVTTSAQHLAFGHGRHACPGRFFVAHELKLIMAHILLNYDIKLVGKLPEKQFLGGTCLPPLKAEIQVRRKKAQA
ncbi:cytochrome P450 [Trichoderma citrinoviride]|uniref:Cytochrome P450 n=1 Tax=Trichoderma citrinoviride TaxID=58853 RepID=A0A2T4B867_9HYPO|nr:cytochrome P450 [Trichoderma citrinoviride]PTB65524.1 cytochrome P450 [Trichoderma citrinoviride]